jgi:hypothetical protein
MSTVQPVFTTNVAQDIYTAICDRLFEREGYLARTPEDGEVAQGCECKPCGSIRAKNAVWAENRKVFGDEILGDEIRRLKAARATLGLALANAGVKVPS